MSAKKETLEKLERLITKFDHVRNKIITILNSNIDRESLVNDITIISNDLATLAKILPSIPNFITYPNTVENDDILHMLETDKPIEIQKFENKLIENSTLNNELMSIEDADLNSERIELDRPYNSRSNLNNLNNLNHKQNEEENFDIIYETTKEKINNLISGVMSKLLKPKEELKQKKMPILDDLIIKFPKYVVKKNTEEFKNDDINNKINELRKILKK